MAKVNPIQLEKHLKGLDYPAKKADIIKQAEQQGADEDAKSALQQLPDQTYDSPTAISKAIGQINHSGDK